MLSETWLPSNLPLELQGGVPHPELDCVNPSAAVKP
jgi:hypothetical protein